MDSDVIETFIHSVLHNGPYSWDERTEDQFTGIEERPGLQISIKSIFWLSYPSHPDNWLSWTETLTVGVLRIFVLSVTCVHET